MDIKEILRNGSQVPIPQTPQKRQEYFTNLVNYCNTKKLNCPQMTNLVNFAMNLDNKDAALSIWIAISKCCFAFENRHVALRVKEWQVFSMKVREFMFHQDYGYWDGELNTALQIGEKEE